MVMECVMKCGEHFQVRRDYITGKKPLIFIHLKKILDNDLKVENNFVLMACRTLFSAQSMN